MEPRVDYLVREGCWITLAPFSYEDVHIPQGFRCDLSSVPRPLWWLVAPFELSVAAPLVHDFLYRCGGTTPTIIRTTPGYERPGFLRRTRKEVDQLFLQVMLEEGVNPWRARVAYHAVRLFGGRAFQEA